MSYKLCYVDDDRAWFTTQPIEIQWGDDWNDIPYEHNAGTPYAPCWHNDLEHLLKRNGELCNCLSCKYDWGKDGNPNWMLKCVGWEGPFLLPCSGHLNSPYCVESINAKVIPWLRGDKIEIFAGTTLLDFIQKVHKAGGFVYELQRNDVED